MDASAHGELPASLGRLLTLEGASCHRDGRLRRTDYHPLREFFSSREPGQLKRVQGRVELRHWRKNGDEGWTVQRRRTVQRFSAKLWTPSLAQELARLQLALWAPAAAHKVAVAAVSPKRPSAKQTVLQQFDPLFRVWLCPCDGEPLNVSPFDLGALACASKSFSFLRENSVIQRAVEAFKGRCSDIDLEQAATEKDLDVLRLRLYSASAGELSRILQKIIWSRGNSSELVRWLLFLGPSTGGLDAELLASVLSLCIRKHDVAGDESVEILRLLCSSGRCDLNTPLWQEKGAVAMALWLPFIRKGFLPLAWAVSFHTEIRDQRNSTLAQRLLLIAKLLVANGAKVELLPRRKQHSFRAMVDEGHQHKLNGHIARRLRRKIEVPQPKEFKAKQLKRPAPPEDAPRKRRSLREIRQYLQLS